MCKTNTFPRPTVLLPLSVQREQSAERKQAEEAQVAERDKAAAEEKARVKQERRQVESVAEDSGDEDVHGNDCDVDDGDKKKAEPRPACINCRRSKVRCVGDIPCERCVRLSLTSSCQRCETKKRGRKRKPRNLENPELYKTLKASMAWQGEVGEREQIERMASLTGTFRSWRELLLTCPRDQQAMGRFLWFCAYLSHCIKDYLSTVQSMSEANRLVSVWLCTNLAEDVNRFIAVYGRDVPMPDPNGEDVQRLAMESLYYRDLPMGVIVLPIYPRPFCPGTRPIVNSVVADELGHNMDEVTAWLSDRNSASKLAPEATWSDMVTNLIHTVAQNKMSFTSRMQFNRADRVVQHASVTNWIKYVHGIPSLLIMFVQLEPVSAIPVAVATESKIFKEEPLRMPDLGMLPTVSMMPSSSFQQNESDKMMDLLSMPHVTDTAPIKDDLFDMNPDPNVSVLDMLMATSQGYNTTY